MHVPIAKIVSSPNDFVVCKGCGAINWYENEHCVQCGMAFTQIPTSDYTRIIGAKDLPHEEAERLLEVYPDEDTEIEV